MTAPRDTTHACPGGCGARVARHLFACKPCWRRLPLIMRANILIAHRAGPAGALAHRQAMRAAALWYDDQRQPES